MKNKKHFLGAAIIAVVSLIVLTPIFSKPSGSGEVIRPTGGRSGDGSGGGPGGESLVDDPNEVYGYTEAPDHVGEKAKVRGKVLKVFTSKSGVTFFDFCKKSSDCPFSAVIFASDLDKFGDPSKYEREVTISGIIRSYQNKAEIIVNDPDQIE